MSRWFRPRPGAVLAWVAVGWLAAIAPSCARGIEIVGTGGEGGTHGGGSGATGGGGSAGGGAGACGEITQVAGDCKKKVCQDGAVQEVADNADPPNDGKACTTDTCSLGEPAFLPVTAGSLCSEAGGKKCDGEGNCVACLSDNDCPPGQACNAGNTCVPPTCMDGEKNGDETDVDCGGMCGATCQPGELCSTTEDCALGTCEMGKCLYSTCADGVLSGDETDVDCGGSCIVPPDSKTCGPGQGCLVDDDCTGGDCSAGVCVPNCFDGVQNNGEEAKDCGGPCPNECIFGGACASAADCAGGPCVDGVCCDDACSGVCEACTAAKKGSGEDGICGAVAVGTDPDNECAAAVMCGVGQCQLVNAMPCVQGVDCQSGFCVDGVCCNTACSGVCQGCTTAKKGAGQNGTCGNIVSGSDPDSECAGATACNGAGACALVANGMPCNAGAECQSGFCADGVCCNTACDAECQACTTAKKGAGSNGTCGPISAGNDPDDECAGALVCATGGCKLPNGEVCFSAAQCISGFCSEQVCCGTACTGACQSCLAAKKGSGMDGTCGNIPFGADPDDECGGSTACSGAGACALYADGVFCAANNECASGHCVDGVCCNTTCTSTCQACSAAKKNSGIDGVCGTIMAGLDPDGECAGGTTCSGSTTCALYPNGTPCTLNGECSSNQCVDGVCCNTACNAVCQACTTAKKGSGANGTCGSIAAGTDPDSECAGAASCSGAASCLLLTTGTPCSANNECQSNYCVDGVCCNTACAGTCQACTTAKKGSGTNGQCGNIVVNTDPDNECGLACNGSGACQ